MFRMIILPVLMSSSVVFAQQMTVEKVKGNKAIVEFSGTTLSAGRTYSIGGNTSDGAVGGSRARIIGGSIAMEFLEYSSSTNGSSAIKDNLISLIARYGWNFETFEAGILGGYTDTDRPGTKYSAVKIGAFGDYNLTPNRPGTSNIYGVSGEGGYSSITSTGGGSILDMFLSGFAKWFVFGPSTALRFDLGYSYEKGTFTSYSTVSQGFALRGGIATYF